MEKDVVIVSACRTAIGKFGGSLKDSNASTMASVVMKEAIRRAGIDPAIINDVRFGCCNEHIDEQNTARVAALLADIPVTVPAVTMNRVCVSAMEAVVSGAAMIKAGFTDVILAGGVEQMSGGVYRVLTARWGSRLQDQVFADEVWHQLYCGSRLLPGPEKGPLKEGALIDLFRGQPYIMGQTAEFLAELYSITREEMDEVALRSHNNAERATKDGSFRAEIIPVSVPQKKGKPPLVFEKDEHFIAGLTMDRLAALPPAFVPKIGKVTAGNSSGLNDGAAAMVIMSAEKARALGLKPLARIKAVGYGGSHPSVMGISPAPAVRNLMQNANLKIADFELMEVNEAFAAQYIACERELGLNREITNINGSGCGLGHPTGATGCRLLVTLLHAMQKRGNTLGLATLCGGGGVSMAVALEML
ncbi:MAG: acetyl-CoA C-acyltransferase [Smithellaceae bacterium]|nr:acetyl-CoA C-acyltransferase [Syntrophaceae bacterium]MDD4241076.1 acetyl-CoA C-acyltransferase [Smithellaceae bacterium]NLX51289.1 acetyl-CoA C-acyltransferase [Deltaproteobacteria bacterium]